MAGTGNEGAVPIHLEYPLEELATRDGKRVFARVVPPGRTAERFKFQETSEEKDLSEEHKGENRFQAKTFGYKTSIGTMSALSFFATITYI